MALTPKQELFCLEYIKDLCAAAACRRAGYSDGAANSYAYDMLAMPAIQARLAELTEARNRQLGIEANAVLREVYEIAMADPAAAYDEHGAYKSIHDIPPALRKTIAGVKSREERFEGKVVAEIIEVKFWDKTRALDMLMRHLALYKDTLKLEGVEDIAAKILEARRRAGRT